MTVYYKSETLLSERFFEQAFTGEMNGDVADTVFGAFCAAMNEYDEATRLERIGCMAKLLMRHDVAEDWLAVSDEVRRLMAEREAKETK